MKVTVTLIHTKFNEHKTLIKTLHTPNWFEWIFLFRRDKDVSYLGHKTVWHFYPAMKPVKEKKLLEELAAIELKGSVLRGVSKNKNVPALIMK